MRAASNRFGSDSVALDAPGGLLNAAVHFPVSLSVEVVDSMAGMLELGTDYEALNCAADNKLPFALHDWHVAWCNHFLLRSGAVRDELRICIVRDDMNLCVAIVPLILTRRSSWGVSVSSLALIGADPALTEIREPLIRPGYEAAVARILQRTLADMPGWDWVEWSGGNGRFGSALAANVEVVAQEPLRDLILDLPPSWEQLRKGLKRNIRESLRHCYNSLKRRGLEFRFEVVSEPAQVQVAVEKFLDLHARRAAYATRVLHRNYFATPRAREFLHEICQRFAQRRTLRIFQLVIHGEVVATRIAFVVGDSLYFYYSGFDPAWARYSVMTTNVAEAIKYAISQGLRTVNLSPGLDQGKLRWGPRELVIARAHQVAPRWRSRLALACFRRARQSQGIAILLRPLLLSGQHSWE